MSAVELYTDGSCLNNPGPGGIGYLIRYQVDTNPSDFPMNSPVEIKEIEGRQGYRYTTNNRMEILACIEGIRKVLESVKAGIIPDATQLNIFSDSDYLCKSINQKWIDRWMDNNWMTSSYQGRQPGPVKNKDLWEQVISVQNELRGAGITMTITWVKGHDGQEFNERVNTLAQAASSGTNQLIDEAFEKTSMANKRRY